MHTVSIPPGTVHTPKDPQTFGKAKCRQTLSDTQEAKTLSPRLLTSQSLDFFYSLSHWLLWQTLYLATLWGESFLFSRILFILKSISSHRNTKFFWTLTGSLTFLAQQSQLNSLQSGSLLGHGKGHTQRRTEDFVCVWLIDNISEDYLPVYVSPWSHLPSLKMEIISAFSASWDGCDSHKK